MIKQNKKDKTQTYFRFSLIGGTAYFILGGILHILYYRAGIIMALVGVCMLIMSSLLGNMITAKRTIQEIREIKK